MKVLYIAGYSRSGSTLLDIALGTHTRVFGGGELTFLAEDWAHRERRCACGRPLKECDVWSGLYPDDDDARAADAIIRRVESAAGLGKLLRGEVAHADAAAYRERIGQLVSHVHARTAADWLVDSSKSARLAAGRFLALQRLGGLDVYVLHLVRAPEATVDSYLRAGSNWALEERIRQPPLRTLRAALGWRAAHARVVRASQALAPERYLRLQYEEVVTDPAAALRSVGAFIGLELAAVGKLLAERAAMRAQHQVGGNRLRLQSEIRMRTDAKAPILPRRHNLMVRLVAGRAARTLGYGTP